jgi:hypothetical protein
MFSSFHIPTLHADAAPLTSEAVPCRNGLAVMRQLGNTHALAARCAR